MAKYILDTHVLIWGIKGIAEAGQESMIGFAKNFLKDCHNQKIDLMVPAIVLGEFLCNVEEQHHMEYIHELQKAFLIKPYDMPASLHFAKLFNERQKQIKMNGANSLAENKISKQELKADFMIVATAKSSKADAIYSHDKNLKKFAGNSVKVLEIPKTPFQQDLI